LSGRVLFFAALLWSLPCSAQERPTAVWLVASDCAAASLDDAVLGERLAVELTSDGVTDVRVVSEAQVSGEASELAVLHVEASPCVEGATRFVLRIDDLLTRKHVERTIDLSEVAVSGRARTIALSLAELLRGSWTELALADAPPTDVPPSILEAVRVRVASAHDAHVLAAPVTTQDVPSEPPPPPHDPRFAVAAAFVVRTFPGARTSPLGARVSVDVVPLRELTIRIDGEGAVGRSLDPLGEVELGYATLGLTLALAATLGDRVLLWVGPRIAAGLAWASGHPYDPATLAGSGLGPVLFVGGAIEVDVTLIAPLSLRFGGGAEGVAVGYEALVSGVPVAGISGAGLGGWVGLALTP
jgi:hypothetical protein